MVGLPWYVNLILSFVSSILWPLLWPIIQHSIPAGWATVVNAIIAWIKNHPQGRAIALDQLAACNMALVMCGTPPPTTAPSSTLKQ